MATAKVLELYGPTFNPADGTAIARSTPRASIAQIRVYSLPPTVKDPRSLPQFQAMLTALAPCLAPGYQMIAVPAGLSPAALLGPTTIHAQQIMAQIQAAARQKPSGQRWKILQETQQKIHEIQQAVTTSKAQTQAKGITAVNKYIRG